MIPTAPRTTSEYFEPPKAKIKPQISKEFQDRMPPLVTLDAPLQKLPSASYEKLNMLLCKDGAWRKVLETEEKVTREMEIVASNYSEDLELKPGKKAMDILSGFGWTVGKLRDSLHHLGCTEGVDILERVIDIENKPRKKEMESADDSESVSDAPLLKLPSALYGKLSVLLRKGGAWRKVLQAEENVTREVEIDASNYSEDFEIKPGKKAMDILSGYGWTVVKLRDSLHHLGCTEGVDILERLIDFENKPRKKEMESADDSESVSGAQEIPHKHSGLPDVSLKMSSYQSVASEGCGGNTHNDFILPDLSVMCGSLSLGYGENIKNDSILPDTSIECRSFSLPMAAEGCGGNTHNDFILPDLSLLCGSCSLLVAAEDEHADIKMPMESDLLEEAVDNDHDQTGVHQESGVGTCKLLLPKSSIPMSMTQDSSARRGKP